MVGLRIRDIANIVFYLVRLVFSLLALRLTLRWEIYKTRKAFEKQLIKQGMRKKDAKKLSGHYVKLASSVVNIFKRGVNKNL